MDDIMIVMQAERHSVHWFVEWPGVGRVPLGEHLLQDTTTVFKPFGELGPAPHLVLRWRLWQVFTWWFDGSPAASPGKQFQHLRFGDAGRGLIAGKVRG